jgi:hypothetical protein
MHKRQAGSMAIVVILAVVGLVVVGFVGYRLLTANKGTSYDMSSSSSANAKSGCVAQSLQVGASGHCVSDVQNLVNLMETGGLIQCPFPRAARLTVNGAYDSATQTQVAAVQSWVNCYNKEEGNTATIPTDGKVDPATWSQMCVYGYRLPKQAGQSTSPYYKDAQAAGQDAGC